MTNARVNDKIIRNLKILAENAFMRFKEFIMKKVISVILSLALVAVLSAAVVGCSKEADKSSTTVTGINYSLEKDAAAGEGYLGFATVKKYVLSDEQSKAVSKENYSNMIDLVIPAEYETENGKYKVNAVADGAFANQLLLRSVTFGSNIETIGAGCLAGCANLSSLTIDFAGASKDAVNDKKTVGYLFGTSESSGCVSATVNYNGGDSSNSATYYIPSALKTITLTGDVVSEYAFNGLNVSNVVLAGNVETIPEGSFAEMGKIVSVTLPATVKSIKKAAFKNSAALIGVNFEALTALTEIGEEAFYGCSKLGLNKTLSFAAALCVIGEKAFYNCAALKAIDLSATTVEKISELAFYGDSALESVKLPADTDLGKGSFKSCEKLTYDNFSVGNGKVDDKYKDAFDEDFFPVIS